MKDMASETRTDTGIWTQSHTWEQGPREWAHVKAWRASERASERNRERESLTGNGGILVPELNRFLTGPCRERRGLEKGGVDEEGLC